MDSERAAEHLQAIRTLMERSGLYRRALAPVCLQTGLLGFAAAAGGWLAGLNAPRGFGGYWMVVGVVALVAAYVVIRKQALREREPFWSPPTRRVSLAMLPALGAGMLAGVLMVAPVWRDPLQVWWLPAIWAVLYGLALHAAGFFMTRGIRLFGWLFVLTGCGFLVYLTQASYGGGMPALRYAHWVMGGLFGGYHLAYGIYLHFTERGTDET